MCVTNSSATTIDLMLSTSPELVKSCETIPQIGNSDHNGMLSAISMCTHPATPGPNKDLEIQLCGL